MVELHESGILSKREFEEQKKKIMQAPSAPGYPQQSPYPQQYPQQPYGGDQQQSATFVQRLLAYLVDATLLLLAQALVLFVVLLVFGLEIPNTHLLAIAELAGLVLDSGLAWQEARGGTFGKRLLKIRVVLVDGGNVGYRQAFIRNFARLGWQVPTLFGALFLLADALLLLAQPRGQRIGDLLAETRVVRVQ